MLFDKIGDGIFIHTEENRGYIKFYSMVVNGRWEPFGRLALYRFNSYFTTDCLMGNVSAIEVRKWEK